MVGFVKIILDLLLRLLKLGSHFLGRFEGNCAWEVRVYNNHKDVLSNHTTCQNLIFNAHMKRSKV